MKHESKFTSAEAADLSGLTSKQVQNWSSRGFVAGKSKDEKGKHRRFNFGEVMLLAIVKVLVSRFPVLPEPAFAIAEKFTLVGTGPSGWGDDLSGPERKPALPFHYRHGPTRILISGDNVSVRPREMPMPKNLEDHILSVNASQIFEQVCTGLNLDARAVLDEAYPTDASANRAAGGSSAGGDDAAS